MSRTTFTFQQQAHLKITPEIEARLKKITNSREHKPRHTSAQRRAWMQTSSDNLAQEPTLPNGVRLAYYNEHRRGFQHGRIKNINGNLVLMPVSASSTTATTSRSGHITHKPTSQSQQKQQLVAQLNTLETKIAEANKMLADLIASKQTSSKGQQTKS